MDIAGEEDERHLRFVLAPGATPASTILHQQAAAAAGERLTDHSGCWALSDRCP